VKYIWAIVAGIAMVSLLAGCGGSSKPSAGKAAPTTSASSKAPVTSATTTPAVTTSGPKGCSTYVGQVATATGVKSCLQNGLLYPIRVEKCQHGKTFVEYGSLVGGVVGKKLVATTAAGVPVLDTVHCTMS
jgi:hypothetical protein